MNRDNQLDFLDIISIISFCIALQNLELNIAQEDLDNQTQALDKTLHENVEELHRHLEMQDKKIDNILRILQANGGVVKNDSRRDI